MRRANQVVAGVAGVAVVAGLTVAAIAVTDRASDEQVDAQAAARERNAAVPPGDTDGDGRTDLVLYRPATATFWVDQSTDGDLVVPLGQPGDQPTTGDFDGDGRADLVAVRSGVGAASGSWSIRSSGDGTQRTVSFGLAGDLAQPGDYDGDGRDDVAVFRPAPPGPDAVDEGEEADTEGSENAQWYVLRSSDGTLTAIPFGIAGDLPVPGDYDGDGITDVAVQRAGTRWIQQSSDGATVARQFGQAGDVPAVVDRGDRDGLAVVRIEGDDQVWYVDAPGSDLPASFPFGRATAPVQQRLIGDFDGDGTTEPAVFDGSVPTYWIWTPTEVIAVPWGTEGDLVAPLGIDPTLGLAIPVDEPDPAEPDD
jgi:hypothetical protein